MKSITDLYNYIIADACGANAVGGDGLAEAEHAAIDVLWDAGLRSPDQCKSAFEASLADGDGEPHDRDLAMIWREAGEAADRAATDGWDDQTASSGIIISYRD